MKIDPKFAHGTIVYLKAGGDLVGMVTGYIVRAGNVLNYIIGWNNGEESLHYEIELTDERAL